MVGSGQSRVPCNRLTVIAFNHILNPLHESLTVFDPHLVGTDVDIRAIGLRNLTEELFKALLEHFTAFFRVHREAKSVLEICGMAGHVDLGHHGDASLTGVSNQLADFVVCVELSFVTALSLVLRVVELWINLALNAPCRIVGKVPVEIIQFVEGHQIKCRLKHIDGLIVATRIVHKAPERICRPVVDFHIGHTALIIR